MLADKQNEDQFDKDGWYTKAPHIKCCKMPKTVNEKEAKVYDILLASHCDHPDKNKGAHECCGAITISKNAIVCRCKKCGDSKAVW